jgi:hypothetical protein
MLQFDLQQHQLIGPAGQLPVLSDDEVTRKLAMLIEGECHGRGPLQAARRFGFSKQRYFQLRHAYRQGGASALASKPRGPKRNYRRTDEVVRQVIRHRFLDPEASPAVIAQKLIQAGWTLSIRSVERVIEQFGLQKKLHRYPPDEAALVLETQRTTTHCKAEPCDPRSLERGVRQLLADKISGNLVGLWLLVPEHLRLGTWDLLRAWTHGSGESVEPRLALQLVHEAALCLTGVRQQRALSQRGFEVLNGLPFLASDRAIHTLLAAHTIADAQHLQRALGKIRQASGHFGGRLLAVDPHRLRSHSKRQMRRQRLAQDRPPAKLAQTFFALDAERHQPVCFTTGTSSRTVTQATPELLHLAASILNPQPHATLVLVDAEHFTADLLDHVHEQTHFDLLVPMPQQRSLQKQLRAIPAEEFTPHWAGYATAKRLYRFKRGRRAPFYQFVQRQGEQPPTWKFNAFLCTADRAEVPTLTKDFPQRWHAEEFFNAHQDLGWDRAGTPNLNIRYGHMTLALLAQAAVAQLRQRLGEPAAAWDAAHLAQALFQGLEGDVRVSGKTIVVTYYNAPQAARLRDLYEHLPAKLEQEQLGAPIPWLYDFKLDFRFR